MRAIRLRSARHSRLILAGNAFEGVGIPDCVRSGQDAADALRPIYDATSRRDGYVSLEVSPLLAYDTAATLDEARRLWRAVGRDNLMIKVPATPQGIVATHAASDVGFRYAGAVLNAVVEKSAGKTAQVRRATVNAITP